MPHHCDLLVEAEYIITQDTTRSVLLNSALVINQGIIKAIISIDTVGHFEAKQHIKLGKALLMPGLINAHSHVAMTFIRGFADDLPLMEWLHKYIFPAEKLLSAELVEVASLLGCAEMMRTGTTAFTDMYIFEDAVCRAVDTSGMRVLAGEVIFSFSTVAGSTVEKSFERVDDLFNRWHSHPRIQTAVAPHSLYTTNSNILKKCVQLAESTRQPLHIHMSETPDETALVVEQYGKRPIEASNEIGLLTPSTTFAHAVDLTTEEIHLLAQGKCKIAHNPKSNMKLASGVAKIPEMFSAGMLPALGTDGAASNNSLNLFSEMSACALLHKITTDSPSVATAQQVLDMATLGGAA